MFFLGGDDEVKGKVVGAFFARDFLDECLGEVLVNLDKVAVIMGIVEFSGKEETAAVFFITE